MSQSVLPQPGERSLDVADGRVMTWLELGDPDGAPLLYCHGTPGAASEAVVLDAGARRAGAFLVAVNRPGFGGSTFQAGRTMADWSHDAVALADHLGAGRMSVLGFSGGGPYALSCGVERPDRFPVIGVVSGATPLDRPGALAAMSPSDRTLSVLSVRAPVLARLLLWVTGATARLAPSLALRSWRAELSAADRRELDSLGLAPAQIVGFLVDGMRHGARGALQDYRLLSEPWAFSASDVTVPVRWWHGSEDATVPLEEARRVVDALPHGELAVVAGGGHLLLRRLAVEIASTIVGD